LASLISFTKKGIYCPQANVYIDPWGKVDKALITHGHSDHARRGHQSYLCHQNSVNILKSRLGKISVQGISFEKEININGVRITFFPAGHIVGSAQIKLENKFESWVISGDYKVQSDSLATNFVPVKCDYFVTESTFGLPVFKWPDPASVFEEINHWWQDNQSKNITSILCAYSLGKAQRIIQSIDHSIGPVLTHSAVEKMNEAIRDTGLTLKETSLLNNQDKDILKKSLIICPPGSLEKTEKMVPSASVAMASGWMSLRGARRRRNMDRGFVLSDHADWNGLNMAITETGAQKVYVTHGYTDVFSKWLNHSGVESQTVETAFEGETLEVVKSESV